jgi:hypothetical protein
VELQEEVTKVKELAVETVNLNYISQEVKLLLPGLSLNEASRTRELHSPALPNWRRARES